MSLHPISGKPQDFAAWAKTPPASGSADSAWERAIIGLAEAGEPRFVEILRKHIVSGVIRSQRASAALNHEAADAAS